MTPGDRVTIYRGTTAVLTATVERVVVRNGRALLCDVRHIDGREVKPTGGWRDSVRLHVLTRTGYIVSPGTGIGGELRVGGFGLPTQESAQSVK